MQRVCPCPVSMAVSLQCVTADDLVDAFRRGDITIEQEDNVAAATDERALTGPIVFKQ
jgi:hypothetical protein